MPSTPSRKGRTVPLAQFHQDVPGDEPTAERLPEGPDGKAADSTGARKVWIAEWGGVAEVVQEDAVDSASNGASATTLDDFKSAIDLSLREYLSGGDLLEAARCILELNAPQFHAHIVKRAVALAMDKAGREREMVAVLLSSLHVRGVLASAHVAAGFKALLETIDDLILDIPDAAALVSHYLADSHLDGLLPLPMLDELAAAVAENPAAASVVRRARERTQGRVVVNSTHVDCRTHRTELRKVIEEYLSSHDVAEVLRRVDELLVPDASLHELVRAAVELALERKDHDRELVSQLLSAVHDEWLSAASIARGFEALLARIDDLALDNPHAVGQLASFMTRAIADEVLPPAFVVSPPPETRTTAAQTSVLTQARALLTASHFGDKRRNVWGAAADGSVADLKREISALWQEYVVSGEISEAVHCVRCLEAPSYHHEVVKRAVSSSIVDGGPREFELCLQLTRELADVDVLTPEQVSLGCTRLVESVADLQLDYPRAPELLAQYLDRIVELRLLTPADEWRDAAARLRKGEAAGVGGADGAGGANGTGGA